MIRRREFIAGLGSATAWPLVSRAQQEEPARRIGVLSNLAADDPEALRRVAVFKQGLQELGWTEGRNVRFDYRWGPTDVDRYRRYVAELAALRTGQSSWPNSLRSHCRPRCLRKAPSSATWRRAQMAAYRPESEFVSALFAMPGRIR